MQPEYRVGFAWVFEGLVVYGSISDLLTFLRSKVHRKKAGNFVGVVKGLIPVNQTFVLFEYLRHDKRFIQRRKERAFYKRMKITRRQRKHQQKLTPFLRSGFHAPKQP
jgi:rRNA processing protein Gar1